MYIKIPLTLLRKLVTLIEYVMFKTDIGETHPDFYNELADAVDQASDILCEE